MSRVQLALNVSDLNEAIDFYSKLFGAEPAKVRPGYANFAIGEPPLKLVLIEHASARGTGVGGALNHLGVEVGSTEVQDGVTCCYAVQDKVWVNDPDGAPWEFYAVLADAPVGSGVAGDGRCCGAEATEAADRAAAQLCC